MLNLPSPHGDKLNALIQNNKLPADDLLRVQQAIARYERWIQQLRAVRGTYSEIVARMVSLLEEYKRYVEVDLIFDSADDFLYRQKHIRALMEDYNENDVLGRGYF